MKVTLDSNIFIADFLMQTPSFSILFESSKTKQIDLYVPQVVIDEVVNKYEQHLNRIFTELNSELKKYNKLSESSITLPIKSNEIQKKVELYKQNLEKKLNDNLATILEYPDVEHKFLAKKAMLNKKPFNSNEKGYRDNLIWENIKLIVSDDNPDAVSSPDLVFITGNSKDFAGKENQLHENLLEELSDKHKSEDVLLYESLAEFTEKVSKLFFAEATKFKEKIENKDFWDFDLKVIIEEYLFGEFIGSDLHNYREYTPYANEAPTIYLINEDFEFQVISVKQLTANEFLIDVEFELETTVTYFVDKSDYWSTEDDDYSVIDLEWNDHVVFVESDITLPISMSLIITSELECKGIEINKIDEDYDW